jgi:Asp-tRNA(Asn)/Glu-tRNA(Gln) amidotransferase A subunit family amidase
VSDIQSAIVQGKTTCVEVVSAYQDRIQVFDKASGLNAITVLNPDALDEAAILDERISRGELIGPVFSGPLLVKDNIDTVGLETTGGSSMLKGHPSSRDAFIIEQLSARGAIIIAKTNMAEWAFSPRQTLSCSFGRTANAYALDRVPAGSSGGTASGIAASFAVLGIGTDTGNSIRGPASHLSLFGLRPTLGLVSRMGIVPLVFDRDIAGPLTRTVADGARLLTAMAAVDSADSYSLDPGRPTGVDYLEAVDPEGLTGRRIGVLRALVKPEDTDPEILSLFNAALRDMEKAGAVIVDPVAIDNFTAHQEADNFCPRFGYDLQVYLSARFGGMFRSTWPTFWHWEHMARIRGFGIHLNTSRISLQMSHHVTGVHPVPTLISIQAARLSARMSLPRLMLHSSTQLSIQPGFSRPLPLLGPTKPMAATTVRRFLLRLDCLPQPFRWAGKQTGSPWAFNSWLVLGLKMFCLP